MSCTILRNCQVKASLFYCHCNKMTTKELGQRVSNEVGQNILPFQSKTALLLSFVGVRLASRVLVSLTKYRGGNAVCVQR